jgi:IS605 OrfB family transposase
MKLITQVKLHPTKEQAKLLLQTMRKFNEACNFISEQAWQNNQFRRVELQKLTYYDVKDRFELGAQSAIHAIYKVADAYRLDRKVMREFRPLGSISYDERILAWRLTDSTVNIWTLTGRERIPFVCGERQSEMLKTFDGQADLLYRDGEFYLHQVCNVDDQDATDPDGFLGVDMGVANIAVDSDRTVHQGKTVKGVRYRHRQLRRKLQKKGTKSSRRRLKKLSGKEQRFAKWTNHNISKTIVAKAKDTGRGIAIEELGGIRDRITARRPQRATLHSWSFSQLRLFIEYKAKLVGVVVVAVDPRNTSRTCPCCGNIDKANRKTQSEFSCTSCGFAELADYVAAVNISRRASVNTPYISTTDVQFCP